MNENYTFLFIISTEKKTFSAYNIFGLMRSKNIIVMIRQSWRSPKIAMAVFIIVLLVLLCVVTINLKSIKLGTYNLLFQYALRVTQHVSYTA